MKLVAGLCAFIGIVQVFFTHSLFGVVWIVAGAFMLGIDYYIGD